MLSEADPEIAQAIANETQRQHEGLELIASENFVSQAVLQAAGSVFTNKYAEGYPGRRYYGGCEFADVVETLAQVGVGDTLHETVCADEAERGNLMLSQRGGGRTVCQVEAAEIDGLGGGVVNLEPVVAAERRGHPFVEPQATG